MVLLPITTVLIACLFDPAGAWGLAVPALLTLSPVTASAWFLLIWVTFRRMRASRAGAADRPAGLSRSSRLSPLLLLDEWRRPLVRAIRTSTRRWRLRSLAAWMAVPLLAALGLRLAAGHLPRGLAEELAGAFVCFGPAVCFLGAAAATAAATAAERQGGTAIQLVLSPMPKREIAAAKVVPYVWPYLAGILAALPLYALMGTSRGLFAVTPWPGPQCAWPMRTFVMLGGDWTFRLNPIGCLNALAMVLGDAAAIWAAAHWGAALTVRMGNLLLTFAWLVPRTLGLLAWGLVAWLCAWVCGALAGGALAGGFDQMTLPVAFAAASSVGLPVYLFGWWAFLAIWPVQGALRAFEQFDRLADEQFRPYLRERFDSRYFAEHVRIRRL
jgi:hypothetical protein